jgi:hypothetical protein
MKRLLGTVTILVAAVAIGLIISVAVHHRSPAPQPAAGATTTTTGGTLAPEIVPGPGQTFVTGTITSMSADNAVGPPLKPPFTITIPSRGQGNADLTGVLVGGRDVEIFWYGGQPLPVTGTGELAIDGGAVTVDGSGTTWMLDGAPRTVTPGHFNLGAPVAVGSGGLATPHQSVAFDAGAHSTVSTTGHAQVHLAPAALHLDGPGSVTLHGRFQLQTAAATRTVQAVVFGPGSYSIDLTPAGPSSGGDTIRATLQGPVSSS